jgi:PAS domain S-box-containing protein
VTPPPPDPGPTPNARTGDADFGPVRFAQIPIPMWVMQVDTLRMLEVNEAALRQYGYTREEFLRLSALDLRPPEEKDRFQEYIRAHVAGEPGENTRHAGLWTHRRKDGSPFQVDILWSAVDFAGREATLVVARDVTREKQMEAQFLQAQKMEAVGRLAGGVAHDFNNLLTTIRGYAFFVKESLDADSPARADVDEILKAADRAANLTRQLLGFARRQVVDPRVVDLNRVLLDMSKMVRRLISEDVELVVLTGTDPVLTRIDPGQLEQVLMNLTVNARDAMPGGGKLTLEASVVDVPAGPGPVPAGRYAHLRVSDTGSGMTPDVQSHLFEPFFTTKAKGKGTGLGLATCYGIVKQNGGFIWAESAAGCGSTFTLHLPSAEGPAEVDAAAADTSGLEGHETVLVAEDEPSVLDLVSRTLREHGYVVLRAGNGDEAQRLSRKMKDVPIHLLITDVVMPRMGGRELAQKFLASRREAKVLFISGYVEHDRVLDAQTVLLQKPFTPDALLAKVREVLDAPRKI